MTFKEQLDDDLHVFINPLEFAVTATIAGVPVDGIFERPYVDALEVAGYNPSLTCQTVDVEDVVEDDAVVIDAVSYRVSGIQPDGTGITILTLEAV
jgi:protein involved in polysaccharide export with SLBB domain